MPDDKKLALSRRQLLGGLGAVGAASAGAGLGTTALFSDEESFNNNQIQAGELDLSVGYEESVSSGQIQFADGTDSGGTLNGSPPSGTFSLSDVKPGDSGHIDFTLNIASNPGYAWMFGVLRSASENGKTEPEEDVEQTLDNNGDGVPALAANKGVELLDAIDVTISYESAAGFSSSEDIFTGTLRDALDYMNRGPNLGVWGLPLDADTSTAYDETHNATGAPISVHDSFVQPGVNAFNDFESGNYDLSASIEDGTASGGVSAAHAVSDGQTKDYVTSVVDVTDFSPSGSTDIVYDWEAGPNNEQAAPDEVWLLIEDGGTDHVVWNTSNQGAGSSGTRSVDIANTTWYMSDGSGGVTTTTFGTGATVKRVGIGRGNTSNARQLDVYYYNLTVDGTDYTLPTKESEYVSSARDPFDADQDYTMRFSWEIDASVDNRIQGDSVTFDLGFYAEQARNNDGSASI